MFKRKKAKTPVEETIFERITYGFPTERSVNEGDGSEFNVDDVLSVAEKMLTILAIMKVEQPDVPESILAHAASATWWSGVADEYENASEQRPGAAFMLGVTMGYRLGVYAAYSAAGADEIGCNDPNCPVHGTQKDDDGPGIIFH